MLIKILIEILILWFIYGAYMARLVYKRGPVGAIFFYPKEMQERVISLGLISQKDLKSRRTGAYVLLIAWMLIVPGIMILVANGAKSYWDCCWQFYVLFLGAEFFDWLFIDTLWVAVSDWWIIPGTEDLNDTWHSVHIKKWKMIRLIPFAVPLAAIAGGIYWGIGKMIGL